ncbi:uncharacterized protein LOC131655917 [Vicia villosa]|uniref:uncharacterized protein LOC131655917 n=1 Tax=Vicia villosa TaxID=3911 RepID=UPI00273BE4E1|nr:uncharacterized protein LOC131655917 [Vicia villosa]
MKGQVAACGRVTTMVRENMMKLLHDSKAKRNDSKRRKEEFEERLRGDDEDKDEDVNTLVDDQLRYATQESLRSHREWENMQQFRRETRASKNVFEHGGSSRASVSGGERLEDISFSLRSTNIDLVRSKSMKQPRAGKGFLKTWRKRLGEVVSKFIIYKRFPMNLSNSPWFHNLIYTASEVGKAKCPTPYEISNVYLEAEYKEMLEWINGMKKIWQERGATIMCDGWTDSINHTYIMNFLVYCHKVVEEVGGDCVVQVVTDNEAALKAAGQKLMEKRPHLYWSSCAAHCLDLCLEDIGKRKSIHNLLSEAKMVTTFIYNHTYIVSLMKKYAGGRNIVRPGVTRFATQFL